MKRLSFLSIIISLGLGVNAQNEDDALRYTMTYFGGTARNMSMAGSFSALGGDFSNVLQNPAGLARFKKDNISFTQNVENPNTKTHFYGTSASVSGLSGSINNFSYVNVYNLDPNQFNNWYGVQLGIGYNRINSFEERITYGGVVDSSILHSFIQEADGVDNNNIYSALPFSAGLAYDVYALDPAGGNTYSTTFTSGTAYHQRTITRKGGMGEYNLSLSGNYANKLFIGGTVNFTKIKFNETFVHNETFSDTTLWLQGIRYIGDLTIEGWGGNARLGAIYLPADWIRLGIAVQSSTLFLLEDNWSNDMSSSTKDGTKTVLPEYVPYGSYNYKVKTPFRANASIGLVFKKIGSLGAEIEFVDYSRSQLSSKKYSDSPYSFFNENAQIENIYNSVFNYKVGAEARITPQFYLRGGYAYYTSPYKESSGNTRYPVQFYTGGLGYNFGIFYMDFAYVLKSKTENYYAYDPTINGSKSTLDFKNSQYLLSLGLRID